MKKPKIKICGIKKLSTLKCCINNNIDFYGLIFYKKSPRNIDLDEALELINYSKNTLISPVGVFVNEPIININKIIAKLKIDYIQLHGEESFEYINEIKGNNKNIKIIKNISIRYSDDFLKANKYSNADFYLFDYKPNNNELPGGNAKKFSWSLLRDIRLIKPWFLSGGINIKNVNEIKEFAIPYGIDISSGVEDINGIKSNEKIISLIKTYASK